MLMLCCTRHDKGFIINKISEAGLDWMGKLYACIHISTELKDEGRNDFLLIIYELFYKSGTGVFNVFMRGFGCLGSFGVDVMSIVIVIIILM